VRPGAATGSPRRGLAALALLLLLAAAPAAAAPPDLGWVERDWASLDGQERGRAVRRFQRDHLPGARPERPEMQQRWDAMTPVQRRELMMGPRRAARELGPPPVPAGRLLRPPPPAPPDLPATE
jgi:hypothetical protein